MTTIKEIVIEHWSKIDLATKLQIKEFLLTMLHQKGNTLE